MDNTKWEKMPDGSLPFFHSRMAQASGGVLPEGVEVELHVDAAGQCLYGKVYRDGDLESTWTLTTRAIMETFIRAAGLAPSEGQ